MGMVKGGLKTASRLGAWANGRAIHRDGEHRSTGRLGSNTLILRCSSDRHWRVEQEIKVSPEVRGETLRRPDTGRH